MQPVTGFRGTGGGSTVPREVFLRTDSRGLQKKCNEKLSEYINNVHKFAKMSRLSLHSLYTPRLSVTTSNDMKWTFPVCQPARLASRASPKPAVISSSISSSSRSSSSSNSNSSSSSSSSSRSSSGTTSRHKVPSVVAQKHICPFPTIVRHVGTYLPNYTSVTSHATATFMMTAVKVK